MDVTKVPVDVVFRIFTACQGDPATLILDVRSQKDFKKKHIAGAYSIRLSANGSLLLDYSKSSYNLLWSKDCWWDKHVVVYGEPKLKRDHPVVAFLAADKHAKSVNIFTEGLEEFEKHYPFLVTASVKEGAKRRYPGEIVPGLLYLGDWDHATDTESLGHIKIRRIITVHNNPDNLKPPSKILHMKLELADVETEDVSKYFNETYTFIEAAKAAKEGPDDGCCLGVLVHCGAGVSRSAALCIAYLMRKFTWPAARARAHCVQRRSIVLPNDGFWRSLCAFEAQLGLQQRSDPTAVSGFSGMDAPAKLAEGAAGEKVTVNFVPIQKVRADAAAAAAGRDTARVEGEGVRPRESNGQAHGERDGPGRQSLDSRDRRRERSRSRGRAASRERRRERARSRSHDRSRERRREENGRRRGDGDRRRQPGSERDGERRRGRSRERAEDGEASKLLRTDDAPGAEPATVIPAPVVLESSKEGKVLSRLEIGLRTSHQRCVFGRLPSSEVVLEHLSISRQHAQLAIDAAGDLFITDLGSAHRTNVDGVWIRPNQARALPIGSVFKLGGSTREFKVLTTPREQARDKAK